MLAGPEAVGASVVGPLAQWGEARLDERSQVALLGLEVTAKKGSAVVGQRAGDV